MILTCSSIEPGSIAGNVRSILAAARHLLARTIAAMRSSVRDLVSGDGQVRLGS
jgi:hypothetical protein